MYPPPPLTLRDLESEGRRERARKAQAGLEFFARALKGLSPHREGRGRKVRDALREGEEVLRQCGLGSVSG
ncbi:hypothetical protein KIPB_013142 [Kipferlia bialata]|uniref:Uncharacterized protein n=1 Tax=Kipferlia bialata TaxID=797122 RepID=A0A9K3GPB1_9EUKA|nr:hypothetical protein KIPB_013142 [Kipferlia bialata]|eukprot:g13142.t1